MWTSKHTLDTCASAELIWSLWSDLPGWTRWNPGVEHAQLHGPFATGSTFTMRPSGGENLQCRLIDVQPGHHFVDETQVGANVVRVSHELKSLSSGDTRITYMATITGPDAANLGPMITSDFTDVLTTLKNMAESRRDHGQ